VRSEAETYCFALFFACLKHKSACARAFSFLKNRLFLQGQARIWRQIRLKREPYHGVHRRTPFFISFVWGPLSPLALSPSWASVNSPLSPTHLYFHLSRVVCRSQYVDTFIWASSDPFCGPLLEGRHISDTLDVFLNVKYTYL